MKRVFVIAGTVLILIVASVAQGWDCVDSNDFAAGYVYQATFYPSTNTVTARIDDPHEVCTCAEIYVSGSADAARAAEALLLAAMTTGMPIYFEVETGSCSIAQLVLAKPGTGPN